MKDKNGNDIYSTDILRLALPVWHPWAKELNGRLVQIAKAGMRGTFRPIGMDAVTSERFPMNCKYSTHIAFDWAVVVD